MSNRVVVPIDLGGSDNYCLTRALLRPSPTIDFIEALIWSYKDRYGRIDEVAFFHGGQPTSEMLEISMTYQLRLSSHPSDIVEFDIDKFRQHNGRRIEIKALSFQQTVLNEIRRGYTTNQLLDTIQDIRSKGLEIGVVLTPGLPLYTPELILKDVELLIKLAVDYVNIYPTIVWEGSGLQSRIKNGWEPMSTKAAVIICREMEDRLRKASIAVPRIGLQPGQDIAAKAVAGVIHPNLRSLVQYERFYDMMVAVLAGHQSSSALLLVNPKDVSLAIGECGSNIKKLRSRLGLSDVKILASDKVSRGLVKKGVI